MEVFNPQIAKNHPQEPQEPPKIKALAISNYKTILAEGGQKMSNHMLGLAEGARQSLCSIAHAAQEVRSRSGPHAAAVSTSAAAAMALCAAGRPLGA